MQLVAGVAQNELINENPFKSETTELFSYSQNTKLPLLFHRS